MTVSLRPAEAADVPRVGRLHHRSRAAAYRDLLPAEALEVPTADMMADWWVARWPYERDTHLMTVAEHDGQLAGFTYLGPDEDGDPDAGELYAIHLDPDLQARGIGRALMVDALAELHRRGFRRALLWVLTGNTHARRFYERGGWRLDGTHREVSYGAVRTPQVRYARPLP
ncbi:MAG TPA: GNAT family N-acetyltransferase [Micromonosporaceae bacterium]